MRPARGCKSPEIVFISVDLPAPFGPSTQTISPRVHAQLGPPQHLKVSVGDVEPLHRQEGLAAGGAVVGHAVLHGRYA